MEEVWCMWFLVILEGFFVLLGRCSFGWMFWWRDCGVGVFGVVL